MRYVSVIYHWEPEGWWAESPDAAGFSAAGRTYEELRTQAREGLDFYFDGPVHLDEAFPDPQAAWTVSTATNMITDSPPARRIFFQATQAAGRIAAITSPAPTATLTVRSGIAHAGG